MKSDELAQFLRAKRTALEPWETGSDAPPRRRAQGMRRGDVARLAAMSTDYYRRLEQARSAPPSPQILDAIARALRLNGDERDYMFRIAGREPPSPVEPVMEVAPPLRQLVHSLGPSPAQVMTFMGETLYQNEAAVALMGDHSVYTGDARYRTYRWFTDPSSRWMWPLETHEEESRAQVAELRARATLTSSPETDHLIGMLRVLSPEFELLWREQKVALCRSGTKTLTNPRLGSFDLELQVLYHEGVGQLLVAFTAPPGSRSASLLRELTAERDMSFLAADETQT